MSRENDKPNGKGNEAKANAHWQNANESSPKFRLAHRAIEERARKFVATFNVYCTKLKELRPEAEAIIEFFDEYPRNTVEILGCKNFPDFCRKRLNRDPSVVYKMLRNDDAPKKRKKKEGEGDPPPEKIPQEAAMRMRTALDKVNLARGAKTDAERDALWKEYDEIAQPLPLVSTMGSKVDHDQPDFEKLTRDLLIAGMYMHQAIVNVVESGILDEGSALLMSVRAALDKGKIFAAVSKRFSMTLN